MGGDIAKNFGTLGVWLAEAGGGFVAWWQGWPAATTLAIWTWISDKLLAPAIVAVIFTALYNIYMERFKAHRDAGTKVADGLREDIRALQPLVTDYWSRNRRAGDPAVESKIIAAQADLLATVTLLRESFEIHIFAKHGDLTDLLDLLTGGDFAVSGRQADLDRAVRASNALVQLRASVTKSRLATLKTGLGLITLPRRRN
ncbi:MAG: hypothetical protein QM608_16235 [Caulobacter sp.]